jgi:hypothetical protein
MDAAPHDSPRTCGVFVTIRITFFVTHRGGGGYLLNMLPTLRLGKGLTGDYSFAKKLSPCAKAVA